MTVRILEDVIYVVGLRTLLGGDVRQQDQGIRDTTYHLARNPEDESQRSLSKNGTYIYENRPVRVSQGLKRIQMIPLAERRKVE